MKFRSDINGLRALAVIAVVIFHFNPSYLPGGFAGVDVFFVISGYLMTSIIFQGITNKKFSIAKFYIARANRIIPALAALCFFLLIFGFVFLPHLDFVLLAKHAISSLTFISNFVFWSESGYFDAASHQKFLLHTWSLSVEWQFYLLYPILIVVLSKFCNLKTTKAFIFISTIIGFVVSALLSYKWPNAAYYLLPTRAWEMMLGGLAFLYPTSISSLRAKKLIALTGVLLILISYWLVDENIHWPGYLAAIPTVGTFLVLQARLERNSFFDNFMMNRIGKWSYSIYLWHWPIAVSIYYFSLSNTLMILGMFLTILLGFLSYEFIEKLNYKKRFENAVQIICHPPFASTLLVSLFSLIVIFNKGFYEYSSVEYKNAFETAKPSPMRESCHIGEYLKPELACEYFQKNITWAVFGDSHSTELAFALANKLKTQNKGIKHFSFSDCRPSYLQHDGFSKCAAWYQDVSKYILDTNNISHVVINHRYTTGLFGIEPNYPNISPVVKTPEVKDILEKTDRLIIEFAKRKDTVYLFYPIPEIRKPVAQLISEAERKGNSLNTIVGSELDWYKARNREMIEHFNNAKYPNNVILLRPEHALCDDAQCYAVKDGKALYFDDNHLSVEGAKELVSLINLN